LLLAADSERVRVLLAGMPRTVPRQVVSSVRDLPLALEKPTVRALLFDPNGVAVSSLRTLLRRAEVLTVRSYITSPRTLRSTELILHSADRGLAGALLCECEADRAALPRQLTSADAECSLTMRMLALMRERMMEVPPMLRGVLVGVATSRCLASISVRSLARLTNISPRSSARWLAAAGLAPPRALLTAFRLAHLGPELWDANLSMPTLARRGGYANDRALRANCKRLLGMSPSSLRRSRTDGELLEGLAGALLRSPSGDAWARSSAAAVAEHETEANWFSGETATKMYR
jgi:AraC-like DNA-binding protein